MTFLYFHGRIIRNIEVGSGKEKMEARQSDPYDQAICPRNGSLINYALSMKSQ
jgi:hypothetical protein